MGKPRIMVVATVPLSLNAFFRNHLEQLQSEWEVHVITEAADRGDLMARGVLVLHSLRIPRSISPLRDLWAFVRLTERFLRIRPQVIQSISPKAGLLAMLAGWLTRVPVRVHVFTGQVWVTKTGGLRWLLRSMDRLLARAATVILVDSQSQLSFLREAGVVRSDQGHVLHRGSVGGVDHGRFRPDARTRDHVRRELGVPDRDVVALFIGRITRDKGILDLAAAFALAARQTNGLTLWIIGPDEEGILDEVRRRLGEMENRVTFMGFVTNPERFMQSADLLCLPSYREGFGTVVIEAAAVGIPSVASRIYGLVDAVVDGETGLLHDPGDIPGLRAALARLGSDSDLRSRLGQRARERALEDFDPGRISEELLKLYGNELVSARRGLAENHAQE